MPYLNILAKNTVSTKPEHRIPWLQFVLNRT